MAIFLTVGDGVPGINKSFFLLTPERQVQLAVLGPAGLGIVGCALLAIVQGRVAAISWLLGVAVAVIPSAFLAARLLGSQVEARALLRAAKIGEIGKFLLTALLFAVIFATVRPLSAPAVFAGFIVAQIAVIGVLALSGWIGDEQAVTKY
ncbi:MAG TPA: ATP synthase subunit I [Gammaproteobacteria bacterium]